MLRFLAWYSLMLLGLALYAMAVVTIGTNWLPDHWLAHLLYYPVVGLIWIYPIAKFLQWIAARRRERAQQQQDQN